MIWEICFLLIIPCISCDMYLDTELRCPQYWAKFQDSCYRFIKSPLRSRNEARKNCRAYEADLVSVSSLEEHGFLVHQLTLQDPQHRQWYVGAHEESPGSWINDGDSTSLGELEKAFIQDTTASVRTDSFGYLTYKFSDVSKKWGFQPVSGDDELLYICEISIGSVHFLVTDDRTYEYGVDIRDPRKVPHGPYFIKQPVDVVFELTKLEQQQYVTLSCLAGGHPTPVYDWYKEDYIGNDILIARKIEPLNNARFTLSGGKFIIHNPQQVEDRGSYHCKATNMFGTVISETVTLSFGSISEFNLKRSPEVGKENWGKAINCDPPQFYPDVIYAWARGYFPNFVEEDKRVFVSYDGALYFSALKTIDQGNYSCSVQSLGSDMGKTGPFFPLRVIPHPNYQQLKFPNNFPKAFPEAPVAGREVRLECVAFG